MHPISISLEGSREKPAQPGDGQTGPLRSTRQEEGSPHLPLSAQCHHIKEQKQAKNTGKRPDVWVASLITQMMQWEGAPSALPSSPGLGCSPGGQGEFCGILVLATPWQEGELGQPAQGERDLESL